MAVEIKELIIRAEIDYGTQNENRSGLQNQDLKSLDEEAIIKACVKQVMKIIKKTQQR